MLKEVPPVNVGFQTIFLGRLDKRKEQCPGSGSIGMPGKEPVLSTESNGSDGIFYQIVVRPEVAIIGIGHDPIPLVQGIGDGLG